MSIPAGAVIVDYGSGNLRSVEKAFARQRRALGLAAPVRVTARAEEVARAERVVLPGVGAFGRCRAGLAALDGMLEALNEAVRERGRPFLGICVGMHLMAACGREHGVHAGLDWLPGRVDAMPPRPPDVRVPHMGWNTVRVRRAHPVLARLDGRQAYFAHSYRLRPARAGHALAVVTHGAPLVAAAGCANMVGVQFHPEKSQRAGLDLITEFLAWRP